MSLTTDNHESNLNPEEIPSRRGLFRVFGLGLLATALEACKKKVKSKNGPDGVAGNQDGGSTGPTGPGADVLANTEGAGDGLDANDSNLEPSLVDGNDTSVSVNPLEELLKVEINPAAKRSLDEIAFALYGTPGSAMFAVSLKTEGFKIGDELKIIAPSYEDPNKGKQLACHVVYPGYESSVHLFDNLRLSGLTSIWLMVGRPNEVLLWEIPCATTDDYAISYDGLPVIDASNHFSLDHDNFYDLMPILNFGFDASAVAAGNPDLLQDSDEPRQFRVATPATEWNAASFDLNYATAPFTDVASVAIGGIYVTDAVGGLIASVDGNAVSVDIGATTLREHNILIVYVKDTTHVHRYFFHLG